LLINSALCASAPFMSVLVCFKVLVFDPNMTVPPIATAIAPIITAGSKPTAPMIIAKIKVSGSHRGFRNKTDLLTALYNVGEVLNLGFDMQDLFVQVAVVIHVQSTLPHQIHGFIMQI
jgi:hypothetical protein